MGWRLARQVAARASSKVDSSSGDWRPQPCATRHAWRRWEAMVTQAAAKKKHLQCLDGLQVGEQDQAHSIALFLEVR